MKGLKDGLTPAKVVATVLTVYGIETNQLLLLLICERIVATVLTVYGIETLSSLIKKSLKRGLQQYLPFTVLKLGRNALSSSLT